MRIGRGFDDLNYYFCDACRYCFSAEKLPDRCPDCGAVAHDDKKAVRPPDVKIGTTIFSKKAKKNKPHKVSHWVKTIGKPYAAYSYSF